MKPAVLHLIGITAAELVTALVNPLGGLTFHNLLLLALISHASLIPYHPLHRLYPALLLAPLIRVLSLSMPLAKFLRSTGMLSLPSLCW